MVIDSVGYAVGLWEVVTLSLLFIVVIAGAVKLRPTVRDRTAGAEDTPTGRIHVLVPVTGAFPEQREALQSLLDQDHPDYLVTFIVDTLDDPANNLIDELCSSSGRARKVVSGRSVGCAQKNHGLIQGFKSVSADVDVLVFCDSTNCAPPGWLSNFTKPVSTGEVEAISTLRAFTPVPETIGGLCQAIYASLLLLLAIMKPKPWGGATVIRRALFERLGVVRAWSDTVVDDLVLGNVLENAGIKLRMDPRYLLVSPVRGQTISGFMSYLDRQILFPKFTNPGVWAATVVFALNISAAVTVSFVTVALLCPLGLTSWDSAVPSFVGLGLLLMTAGALWRTAGFRVNFFRWMYAFVPCIFLSAWVVGRSVFRHHIDWHGRRYFPGRGGTVLAMEETGSARTPPGRTANQRGA
ncbi:MAG: glycosyltransferase [Pseudomonadota bacterium]